MHDPNVYPFLSQMRDNSNPSLFFQWLVWEGGREREGALPELPKPFWHQRFAGATLTLPTSRRTFAGDIQTLSICHRSGWTSPELILCVINMYSIRYLKIGLISLTSLEVSDKYKKPPRGFWNIIDLPYLWKYYSYSPNLLCRPKWC